jgi:hypothetical protein
MINIILEPDISHLFFYSMSQIRNLGRSIRWAVAIIRDFSVYQEGNLAG